MYLEYVGESQPAVEEAALELGRWHHRDHSGRQPWHVHDQLAQRLAVSDLDWSAVAIAPGLATIWNERQALMAGLDTLPQGITHGDFSLGNLRVDDGGVVAIDWATLGVSPVGFDLAHLALAGLNADVLPLYLEGLQSRYEPDDVRWGTAQPSASWERAGLTGWRRDPSRCPETGYANFVKAHRP